MTLKFLKRTNNVLFYLKKHPFSQFTGRHEGLGVPLPRQHAQIRQRNEHPIPAEREALQLHHTQEFPGTDCSL